MENDNVNYNIQEAEVVRLEKIKRRNVILTALRLFQMRLEKFANESPHLALWHLMDKMERGIELKEILHDDLDDNHVFAPELVQLIDKISESL